MGWWWQRPPWTVAALALKVSGVRKGTCGLSNVFFQQTTPRPTCSVRSNRPVLCRSDFQNTSRTMPFLHLNFFICSPWSQKKPQLIHVACRSLVIPAPAWISPNSTVSLSSCLFPCSHIWIQFCPFPPQGLCMICSSCLQYCSPSSSLVCTSSPLNVTRTE